MYWQNFFCCLEFYDYFILYNEVKLKLIVQDKSFVLNGYWFLGFTFKSSQFQFVNKT